MDFCYCHSKQTKLLHNNNETQKSCHTSKHSWDTLLIYSLPVEDSQIENLPYLKFPENSPELEYILQRRKELGGFIPARNSTTEALKIPPLTDFKAILKGTGTGHGISTTMAFVRMLGILVKDKNIGNRVVPIVPDESRTFGMEGMFRQLGIWSQVGQLYTPQDATQLMHYKEDKHGQVLQEGINEAGGMCDWIAAGTAYCAHNVPMIPFYIFYSMFGFQRVGDLIWAAADQCSRGFLLGGTAGKTTLNGEGLQHEDGHSQIYAATVPNCISYDPTFAFEVAVIVQDGMRRMFANHENIFYYITLMNENYQHPELPKGVADDILRGMYLLQKPSKSKGGKVHLLGSGTILNESLAAAKLLEDDWQVAASVWSCPSFNELGRDGKTCERYNRLHPSAKPKQPHISRCLADTHPVIASTDYSRAFAEQVRAYINAPYTVLGTDGFGRSDTRENLRRFFEVNRYHIVIAALKSLADNGTIAATTTDQAIKKYAINPDILPPWLA